jgi:glycosyltransferase involved in cell wall biosynthesis
MRIGIDARFYGPIGKGLGRYVQEVVDNITKINNAQSGDSFEYVIFLSPENFDEFVVEQPGIKKVKLPCAWYGWQEQIIMPYYIAREKLDLIHFPHFNVPILTPVRFVVTIHDLILTHFPTIRATTKSHLLYYFKNFAYRLVIFSALRRAKKIIAVSQFTKNDIISKFKVNPDKIVVTYEGAANLAKGHDSLFVAKMDSQEILAQHHIPHNFLLYVGNAYPHKNLETLLRVFSRLHQNRPELRLVLVGKIDYFYKCVQETARALNLWQKENINNPVIFPGYVPDVQLETLYSEAQAYVFPSLYEGFGLPPLEAMARNCPVVSSDRSSLPEILGEAAIYFNPDDEADIFTKIDLVLSNPNLRQKLIESGRVQAKKYSWWECANETLAVYRAALR